MRDRFKGFYGVTEDVEKEMFSSRKTIFIFDTNCFLNLYRCEKETKNDFISVVELIKDRLWFPFQICLEYQRNRLGVISSSLKNLNEIKKELSLTTDSINVFCNDSDKSIKNKYHQLHSNLCLLKEDIEQKVKEFIVENIDNRLSDNDFISKSDEIRNWIDMISIGKIAEPLKQDEINKINDLGNKRYSVKVGPGWMDEKEKKDSESFFDGVYYKDKYGDLYLWHEILNKVEHDDNIKNVIFITNDVKNDWWYKVHGKTIGPLECLRTEILNKNLNSFNMYTQPSFLSKAKSFLSEVNVKDSSIEELERLSEEKKNEILNKYKIKPHSYYYKNIFSDDLFGSVDLDNESVTLSKSNDFSSDMIKIKHNLIKEIDSLIDQKDKLKEEYNKTRELINDNQDYITKDISNEAELYLDSLGDRIINIESRLKGLAMSLFNMR